MADSTVEVVDHQWDGNDIDGRTVALGDSYDFVLVFYQENIGPGVAHLGLAYAWYGCYGVYRQYPSTSRLQHYAQDDANPYWQGLDSSDVVGGTDGDNDYGTNKDGKTYRLIGLKFGTVA